ncbi:MAG: hypothetical protein ACT4QC_24245 [Planctomycetaceae bacterium]
MPLRTPDPQPLQPWNCPICGKGYRLRADASPPAQCPKCRDERRQLSPSPSDRVPPRERDAMPAKPGVQPAIAAQFPANARRGRAGVLALFAGAVLLLLAGGTYFCWPNTEPVPEAAKAKRRGEPTLEDVAAAMPALIRPFVKTGLTARFDDPPQVQRLEGGGPPAWRATGKFDAQNEYGVYMKREYAAEVKHVPRGEGRTIGLPDDRDPQRPFVEFDEHTDLIAEYIEIDGQRVYQSPTLKRSEEKQTQVSEATKRREKNQWRHVLRYRGTGEQVTDEFRVSESGWRVVWTPGGPAANGTIVTFGLFNPDGSEPISVYRRPWSNAPLKFKFPKSEPGAYMIRVSLTPPQANIGWMAAIEQ